ncbi:MAG TPA: hypothetical protein VJ010_02555 [Actinomycetota bacterium]|nr:hypothetical protein [Actinomycetota bacterium]HMC42094.1 hypothetical protein [Acidimicrobiales bacterium]
MLVVKVLTGVFDPPPSYLAVPWLYLSLVGALTLAAAAGAELTVRAASSGRVEALRDLSPDSDQARSKRSRFMTLSHAATKSRTNFSLAPSLA